MTTTSTSYHQQQMEQLYTDTQQVKARLINQLNNLVKESKPFFSFRSLSAAQKEWNQQSIRKGTPALNTIPYKGKIKEKVLARLRDIDQARQVNSHDFSLSRRVVNAVDGFYNIELGYDPKTGSKIYIFIPLFESSQYGKPVYHLQFTKDGKYKLIDLIYKDINIFDTEKLIEYIKINLPKILSPFYYR